MSCGHTIQCSNTVGIELEVLLCRMRPICGSRITVVIGQSGRRQQQSKNNAFGSTDELSFVGCIRVIKPGVAAGLSSQQDQRAIALTAAG